ncbi:MAG: translation initiation factor IF-2 [Phycisphaerae bacterium]|nr:translation initiation factor IF-2 [Phycisphaerae bacterium]
MAARRIHHIAKDLGIDSKAIIAKCIAEDIPKIKDHMSVVSAGLEATIKEWFSAEHQATTAVETSAPVDLEKVVKAKPASRAAKAKNDEPSPTATSDSSTAVAEPPKRAARKAAPPAEATPPTPEPSEPAPKPARPTPAAKPAVPKVDAEPPAPARVTIPAAPAPAPAKVIPPPPPTIVAPVAPPPPPAEVQPPLAPAATAPPAPTAPVVPAPMNVPTRPKVVRPVGQKLEVQAPVKLSGPKVVRVEAPEVIDVPRARRPGPPGDGPGITTTRGPRGGAGVSPAAGGSVEESDRAARRGGANKRRSPTTTTAVPDRRKGRSGDAAWVGGAGVFSEQDLIEREARLLRAGGFLRKRRQDLKRQEGGAAERALSPAEVGGKVRIAAPFTIKDLSAATGVKGGEIVKTLFEQGIITTINAGIDPAKAQEIMIDYDIELEVVEAKTAEEAVSAEFEKRDVVDLRPRGPVVTILGHVDHGKTSLLDKIRNANVAAGEAGGITQRTSAFRVPVEVAGEKKEIVFFDTPGHQAFTNMRARGANITDIVVLVVSPADGGVMPQTVESISHAKAAKVPIVVALNKIDRPEATEANIQRTLGQLAEHGLNPTQWGGDTEVVKTSGLTGQGIKELLEVLDYQAQLRELKADFGGFARGTVIEARVEEGRGAVANLLLQDGKLKVGDFIVAGRGYGRVRDITDDRGKKLKEALPPIPVQISGIDEVPDAGDKFFVVDSLRKAQDSAEQRRQREREAQLAQPKATLDRLFSQMAESDTKEILVVLKAAEQGTVDVLKSEVEKVTTSEVKVRVLHAAVGGITESDVQLAEASKAVIIGFNVIASGKARGLAEQKGVEIRPYQVIYHITDDLKKAAEGLLAPELRQDVLGHAEVRKVFKVSKVGAIAGCYVTDGVVQRDALIRVTRNDVVIENDRKLEQLKRFKDDAKEVRAGMECGMKIVGYDDIKEGDVLECYKNVEVKRTL